MKELQWFIAFGALIRNKREQLGFSIEVFAQHCEMETAVLSDIEAGLYNLGVLELSAISRGFKLKIQELLESVD